MENINETGSPKRTAFLTILCILTFIWSGMGTMTSLFTTPVSDILVEQVKNYYWLDEKSKEEAIKVYEAGWNYHLPNFALYLCSIAGAIFMWNLKKIGFHFYTASNLGLLFLPILMLDLPIGLVNIMLTVSFIGMYAVHLKEMK